MPDRTPVVPPSNDDKPQPPTNSPQPQ
jgi:hypothetical protein